MRKRRSAITLVSKLRDHTSKLCLVRFFPAIKRKDLAQHGVISARLIQRFMREVRLHQLRLPLSNAYVLKMESTSNTTLANALPALFHDLKYAFTYQIVAENVTKLSIGTGVRRNYPGLNNEVPITHSRWP